MVQRQRRFFKALAPAWYRPVDIISQIWLFSEMIVMLTNRRRRALHDFIAGTIVTRDPPSTAANADGHNRPTQRGRSRGAPPTPRR